MTAQAITSPPDRLGEQPKTDALTARELLLVDAIAERVVELLHDEHPRGQLVDAQTLARTLGVTRQTVYTHAEQLGARRIGDGPRGRLRFDLDTALQAWTACVPGRGSSEAKQPAGAGKTAPRRRRRTAPAAQLLPIKGPTSPASRGRAA